jgi:hypothetical protein
VLLLNSSNCVTLSIAVGGLDTISALTDCQNLQNQFSSSPGSLAHLVGCLRGTVVGGLPVCADASTVTQPLPADFSKIDLDHDQAHNGQDLIVLAFVSTDNPVTFETDAGTFISRTGGNVGQSYTCSGGSADIAPNTGDPDCDGLPGTVGDGVVVARLRVDAATPRGTHHVTVTQEGVAQLRDFHVVGIPASITFTTLAGKTSIETGATTPPTSPGADRLPTDCVINLTAATTGLPGRPEKAAVVTKALDSDGNEVVGALLHWDHPFVSAVGSPDGPLPQGGVALPQHPTFDLGGAGIGFPQVVCGGGTTGVLTEDVRISNILNPAEDTSVHAVYAIDVVAATPAPSVGGVSELIDPATLPSTRAAAARDRQRVYMLAGAGGVLAIAAAGAMVVSQWLRTTRLRKRHTRMG